jgi:hypothetical protein
MLDGRQYVYSLASNQLVGPIAQLVRAPDS